MRSPAPLLAILAALSYSCLIRAQSTQGLITGRIIDSRSGRPIASAPVTWTHTATGTTGLSSSNSEGYYYLAQLSPGRYRVRVTADNYQAQDLYELELLVAARLELNFRLRPLSDVWEQNEFRGVTLPNSRVILDFFGPDVDSTRSSPFEGQPGHSGKLEATVSDVIEPAPIRDLPLAGRDVYTALILLPGVTADTGTARGLGLSIAGQRPSSGNFLLDGLENNNSLVTGPLTAIPPETIEEYRISSNNYAPAYGRTSGFIANAVTRSGGDRFHGIGYFYLNNDVLNANGFQQNMLGLPRAPTKQLQTGFRAGGPIARQLFWSGSYERLRSRSRLDPLAFVFPSTAFMANLETAAPATRELLQRFAPPVVAPLSSEPLVGTQVIQQPVTVDRSLALARIDYRRAKSNYFGRITISRVGRPDFVWSPYPEFTSGLDDNAYSIATGWSRTLTPTLLNEAKLGWNSESAGWDRAHPEIPTLSARDATRALADGTPGRPNTSLPGSRALYSYRNNTRSGEVVDNLTWTHGRHIAAFGGGLLIRNTSGYLNLGRDGNYFFASPTMLAQSRPSGLFVSVLRGTNQLPDFNRTYRSYAWQLFAQDTFRLTARLVLNYGLRYEHYGAPINTGATLDSTLDVQPGMAVWQPNALQLATPRRELYRTDGGGWAPRFGISYDLTGNSRTVIRGAYGLFYDHPFDNLWQTMRNNNIDLPTYTFPSTVTTNYLTPVATVLAGLRVTPADTPVYTMFDPNFRNARMQNYFYGIQHRMTENISVEVNGLGSLGRHLMTTDIINREFSTLAGRVSPKIPYDVQYRAPQGSSSYQALTAAVRFRSRRAQAQVSYTWSHTIDNQSEPLAFDTFNLFFTQVSSGDTSRVSAFSRQFDSSVDRANSDFDQRHNLVFFSIWELPSPTGNGAGQYLLRDWKFSQLAAFRSGFPYTVYANATGVPAAGVGLIEPARANLNDPANALLANPVDVAGGKMLLNRAAFSAPPYGVVGTAGRNAFRGPGLYNVDVSLSRSFAAPWLGEGGRLTVRADAFNVLNHANLNNPAADFGVRATFGTALYGRQDRPSGFPSIFPLNETARQVQLMLRLEW